MKRRRASLVFAPHYHPKDFEIRSLVFLWSLSFVAWCLGFASFAAESDSPRQRLSFNSDWLFIKGDPTNSLTTLDYQSLKPWLVTIGPELTTNSQTVSKPEGNPGFDVPYRS